MTKRCKQNTTTKTKQKKQNNKQNKIKVKNPKNESVEWYSVESTLRYTMLYNQKYTPPHWLSGLNRVYTEL